MDKDYIKRKTLKNVKIFIHNNIFLNSLDDIFTGFLLVANRIYSVDIMFCYCDNNIYQVFDIDSNKNPILVDVYLTLSINDLKYQRFFGDIKVYSYDNNNYFNMLKNFTDFSVLNNE